MHVEPGGLSPCGCPCDSLSCCAKQINSLKLALYSTHGMHGRAVWWEMLNKAQCVAENRMKHTEGNA